MNIQTLQFCNKVNKKSKNIIKKIELFSRQNIQKANIITSLLISLELFHLFIQRQALPMQNVSYPMNVLEEGLIIHLSRF